MERGAGAGCGPGGARGRRRGQVREALASLPAEQREALALAYFGGYTQREVASLVGVPLGTVKSRMFTGTRKLRTLLGPHVEVDGGEGR